MKSELHVVSILILMDYQFLQRNRQGTDDIYNRVSILILMDYQFLLIKHVFLWDLFPCFNPYFNGLSILTYLVT